MDEKKIIQHFEGKTIFITGASGFLAKIFLEKILRVQPNVKKLYLLIRSASKRSTEQRLQEEVVDTELFRVLRQEWGEDFKSNISSKITPVSGDVSHEYLGITNPELREDMWREIDIVVNSAATTKFDERYDVAFGINVMGTKHVQDFARKCSKLEMLLHVSTAYVHGTRAGLILEKPFQLSETLIDDDDDDDGSKIPNIDIEEEKKLIDQRLNELMFQKLTEREITRAMKDFGIQRAIMHGWPNTYVFTKAMGEMLLGDFTEKASNNVVIIRPTIITSTYSQPFPGWIEGLRTLDSIYVAYGKDKLKFFVGDPESILDMIPGDMVVDCMIAAIAAAAHTTNEKQRDLIVYHIGSSMQNPIKYEAVKQLMHHYLTEVNPMLDSKGKAIRVGKPTTLSTMASFHNYIALHYLPFVKVLQLLNIMSCNHFKDLYTKARNQINHATRLAELYKPYLFSEAIFADFNTEHLRMAIRGAGSNKNNNGVLINFDPKCIQWDEYFVNTHFSGIAKYVLK